MNVKTRFNIGDTAYIPIADKTNISKNLGLSYVAEKITIHQVHISIIGFAENEIGIAIFYVPFEMPKLYTVLRKIEAEAVYATEEECEIHCDRLNKEIADRRKLSDNQVGS